MAIDMEYLSYSRLSIYESCPREFYLKYIAHAPAENPTTEYWADYGSLIHAIIENMSNAKGLIPKSVLVDMFYNGAETRDGVTKGFNDIQFPTWRNNAMQKDYHQQGMEFIGKLATRDYSTIVGSEVEFNFKVADDTPPIHGFIDRICRTQDGIVITDFKSSKVYDQHKCDTSRQMSIYGLAWLYETGEFVHHYLYEFPRFDTEIVTYRTYEQLMETKQWIIDTWHDINMRTEWPITCGRFFHDHFCEHCISTYDEWHALNDKKAKHG